MVKCNCDKCQGKKVCRDVFEAVLTGEQEVTFTETYAKGYLKVVLKDDCLFVSGYFENLRGCYDPEIGSHIHLGYAGQDGEILFDLTPDLCPSQKSGCFKAECNKFMLTQDQIRQLLDRQMYVNIHTTIFPDGELRGQILPRSYKYYIARLSGVNEVPPITVPGRGILLGELKRRKFVVSGSFGDLSGTETGANIHCGVRGATGPVAFPLGVEDPQGSEPGVVKAERNTYTLSCADEDKLKCNEFYVNITTDAYPTGEIRSQFYILY